MSTYSIGSCDADYPFAMALIDAVVMRLSTLGLFTVLKNLDVPTTI